MSVTVATKDMTELIVMVGDTLKILSVVEFPQQVGGTAKVTYCS